MNWQFHPGDLRYLPLGVFLFSLPFSHTVALRLLSLLAALLIVVADSARGRGPRHIPLRLPLALWGAMALLSLAWAVRPAYSLREILNEVGYPMITFLVCYAMAADERACRFFGGVLVASFVAIAVVGLYWFGNGFDQFADAPNSSGGHYSTYLVTLLPLLMVVSVDSAQRRFPANALGPLLLLLLLAGGYGAGNRAFWVAVILSVLTFARLYALRAPPSRVKVRVLSLAAIVVVLASVGLVATVHQRAVTGISDRGSAVDRPPEQVDMPSVDARFPLWAHVVTLIRERPLTGGGFGRGAYGKELTEHFANPLLWHGHNLLLNYGLQMGIGGMLVLVVLFGALAREFLRHYRADDTAVSLIGLAGVAMLVGFLVKNMTDDFFVRQNSLMFWSVIGLILGFRNGRTPGAPARGRASTR
jgi:O-antigen ligase